MIKRLLSYIVPINIHKKNSDISKTLEVTWANGQLVLDSRNTNYSYGSLQRVLRKGLKHIGFENVRAMKHILLLGVGGGSVIKTLHDEIGYRESITGVEIDPNVIEMANEYFGLSRIPKLQVIIDDAFEFTLRTKDRYDLIIVDIFRDTEMPKFLFESFFAGRLGHLLSPEGYLLFNTMTLSKNDNLRNAEYIRSFDAKHFQARALPKLEHHNELIVVKKTTQK